MLTLDNIVRLGEVDADRVFEAVQPRIVLVDFKNDRPRALKDRAPRIRRDAEAAVAIRVRLGDWHERHVAADVLVAVEIRQRAQHDRHEFHEPARLELPLIVADVPAIVGEALLLGVAFDDLNARTDHKAAAHLDVLDFSLTRSERVVEQFGKARAEAVIHPVAGLHRLDGLLRRDKLCLIVIHKKNSPYFDAF